MIFIYSYLFSLSFIQYFCIKSNLIFKDLTSSGFFILITMLSRIKKGLFIAFSAQKIFPYCFLNKFNGSLGSQFVCSSLTYYYIFRTQVGGNNLQAETPIDYHIIEEIIIELLIEPVVFFHFLHGLQLKFCGNIIISNEYLRRFTSMYLQTNKHYDNISGYNFIVLDQMMNSLRMGSRSVSNDLFYQRVKKDELKSHRKRLQEIKDAPVVPHHKNKESKKMLKQLHKSKQALHKVEDIFDPIKIGNKALVQHIHQIKTRRSSMFEIGSSLKNLQHFKSFKQEQQKKEILKQNIKLVSKIMQEKSKMTTKRQIREGFQEYEKRKDQLRKVQSKSHF